MSTESAESQSRPNDETLTLFIGVLKYSLLVENVGYSTVIRSAGDCHGKVSLGESTWHTVAGVRGEGLEAEGGRGAVDCGKGGVGQG